MIVVKGSLNPCQAADLAHNEEPTVCAWSDVAYWIWRDLRKITAHRQTPVPAPRPASGYTQTWTVSRDYTWANGPTLGNMVVFLNYIIIDTVTAVDTISIIIRCNEATRTGNEININAVFSIGHWYVNSSALPAASTDARQLLLCSHGEPRIAGYRAVAGTAQK